MIRIFVIILILTINSCVNNEFAPNDWSGGNNELKVVLSEHTVSLSNYTKAVDTIFISTNCTTWDFYEDSLASWCRCAKIDSMLIIFVDENPLQIPRMAKISVNGYFNTKKLTETLSIVQPATNLSDLEVENLVPLITFEFEKSWDNIMSKVSWSFTDTQKRKILAELGMEELYNLDFNELVERRYILVKAIRGDGVFSENVMYDHTSASGYWYKNDGTISDYGGASLCCEFKVDDIGNVEYDKGHLYLHPMNVKNKDSQYFAYYVFSYGKKCVMVEWILDVSKYEDYDIVREYNLKYVLPANIYEDTPALYQFYELQDSVKNIEELIGGDVDCIMVYRSGDTKLPLENPLRYEGYIDPSSITLNFNENGLTADSAYCMIYLNKDLELLVRLISMSAYNYELEYPENVKGIWILGNTSTRKAVEINLDIDIKNDDFGDDGMVYYLNVNIPSLDYDEPGDVYNDNLYEYFSELDAIVQSIEVYMGASIEYIYMNKPVEASLTGNSYVDGEPYSYWFGANGVEEWVTGDPLITLQVKNRFACLYHILDSYPATARCIFRFLNDNPDKICELRVTVNIDKQVK